MAPEAPATILSFFNSSAYPYSDLEVEATPEDELGDNVCPLNSHVIFWKF